MKGTTLKALGLNLDDMDARVLLDEGFNCREYGPVSYTHLTLPTICSV